MTQIKKILIALCIIACGISTIFFFRKDKEHNKILILTSTGGGGHLAASAQLNTTQG